MKKFVNLRKVGKFYNTYESDAYVLHALMGYEVGEVWPSCIFDMER